MENAVKTQFIVEAHPDHIEAALHENLREKQKVEAEISQNKYKTSFTMTSMDQGGFSQESKICVKLFKVDDKNTAIEFQNLGGN